MKAQDLFDTFVQHASRGAEHVTDSAADGKSVLLSAVTAATKALGTLASSSSPAAVMSRLGLRAAGPSLTHSALTFGAGVMAGAVAGVLLAPRAGRETRADLARRLDALLQRGRSGLDDLKDRAEHEKDSAADAAEPTQDALGDATEPPKDAAHKLGQELSAGASHLGKTANSPVR